MALGFANEKGLVLLSVLHPPRRSPGSPAPPSIFLNHHRARERRAILIFTFLMGARVREEAPSLKIRFKEKATWIV